MQIKFNRLLRQAQQTENLLPFHPDRDRFVVFSDHHKGDGSPADDFRKNSQLYEKALVYYKREGYRLIAVGDNEELWENSYSQILPHYEHIIAQEIDMAPASQNGDKIRIWGNHDKEVSLRRFQKTIKKLNLTMLENVQLRESLCLGPDIFLIHGHQGRFFEDIAWRLSRWAVHFIWKTIQKLLDIGIDGPAENIEIREDLEKQYYAWAKSKQILLICGHTHQAIFGSLTRYQRLEMELGLLEQQYEDCISEENAQEIGAEINRIRQKLAQIREAHHGNIPQSFEERAQDAIPCYFNSGCCGYTNGITCIEIDKRQIRLIKWDRNLEQRIVLVEGNLESIIQRIKLEYTTPPFGGKGE